MYIRTPCKESTDQLVLHKWFTALQPYKDDRTSVCSSFATLLPSILPNACKAFTGFMSMSHGIRFLSRWYEAEIQYITLIHNLPMNQTKSLQSMLKESAKRLTTLFNIETEWVTIHTRLSKTSYKPRKGKASLFYADELLSAFVDQNAEVIEQYGILLKNHALRDVSYFNGHACMQLFISYAIAATHEIPLDARNIRNLWDFVHTHEAADGPGECFKIDSEIQQTKESNTDSILKSKWTCMSGVILARILETRSCNSNCQLHPLLPWLVEMMDPCSTMSWSLDRYWWLNLFKICEASEQLIYEYLTYSLKPRLVLHEININDETELIMSLSLHMNQPSRALQQFRMLLSPWTIRPELASDLTAYLVPKVVWKDAPCNNHCSSLHPLLQAPLAAASHAYRTEYYTERRISWCHWYSTATVDLKPTDKPVYQLNAPLFAIHIIATIIDLMQQNEPVTIMSLVNKCQQLSSPHTISTSHDPFTQGTFISFWLTQFIQHKIIRIISSVTNSSVTIPSVTNSSVYGLCVWDGLRTVPIPDIPSWWHTLSSKKDEDEKKHPSITDELLATKKELVEATAVNTLKHMTNSAESTKFVAYICNYIRPYVIVSPEEVLTIIDTLVKKGFITRVGERHLSYDDN